MSINQNWYKKLRAKFYRLFRRPVNLDEYHTWPTPLVEGDYYSSLGITYKITNGVWKECK